jgi:hypothetical protein
MILRHHIREAMLRQIHGNAKLHLPEANDARTTRNHHGLHNHQNGIHLQAGEQRSHLHDGQSIGAQP